jgi:hypothetical protein
MRICIFTSQPSSALPKEYKLNSGYIMQAKTCCSRFRTEKGAELTIQRPLHDLGDHVLLNLQKQQRRLTD